MYYAEYSMYENKTVTKELSSSINCSEYSAAVVIFYCRKKS